MSQEKTGVTILVSCIRVNTSPPIFFIHARVRIFPACFQTTWQMFQSTALSDTVGKNSTCQQQFCLKTHIYHNNEALTEPLVNLEPELIVLFFFICWVALVLKLCIILQNNCSCVKVIILHSDCSQTCFFNDQPAEQVKRHCYTDLLWLKWEFCCSKSCILP